MLPSSLAFSLIKSKNNPVVQTKNYNNLKKNKKKKLQTELLSNCFVENFSFSLLICRKLFHWRNYGAKAIKIQKILLLLLQIIECSTEDNKRNISTVN